MSVHKICFYGEMEKVVPELSRILNITVLSTSLGTRVFAWRFILNENILFCRLFSNNYPKIKFTAKHWSDLHVCYFYSKVTFFLSENNFYFPLLNLNY